MYKKLEKDCWICGKEILITSNRQVYCSDKCMKNRHRAYSIDGKLGGISPKQLSQGRPKNNG